jgi:23S rRNA pseudouridine2605 synthase
MRLNKYIAHNSIHSRREADRLIFDGKVMVNGQIAKTPAIDVDSDFKIIVNGRYLKKREEYTILVYNKPKGELVTKSDPKGRKTIFHSLPTKYRGFSPVGRLDYASEGVLILSDAIDIVDKLMTSNLERVYKIKVSGAITQRVIQAMEKGVEIEKSQKGAHEYSTIDNMSIPPFNWFKIIKSGRNFSTLKVSISEGKNRELRRFFGEFDLNVLDLKRVSYGFINLNALPTGKKRFLSTEEYDMLREFINK